MSIQRKKLAKLLKRRVLQSIQNSKDVNYEIAKSQIRVRKRIDRRKKSSLDFLKFGKIREIINVKYHNPNKNLAVRNSEGEGEKSSLVENYFTENKKQQILGILKQKSNLHQEPK